MSVNMWMLIPITILVFVVSKILKLVDGIKAVGSLPGLRVAFEPYAFPGALLPISKWNPGLELGWRWRKTLYKQVNSNTISVVPFLVGSPALITSDIEVCKQILSTSGKTAFGKRKPRLEDAVSYWGTSLLLADGDVWRKHRRIVGPAFSQELYELVWSQSLQLYSEMLAGEGYEDKQNVNIHNLQEITSKFTFLIIGRCGFDFPFKWLENSQADSVSFPEAIRYFADNLDLFGLPKSLHNLPLPRLIKLNKYINEIRTFMENKISEKEFDFLTNGGEKQRNDIFSMLVQANQAESDAKLQLSYSEVISDIFLMLFAGHETTSHALAATLACVARHPNIQQGIVSQILSVVGTDRDPCFEDYSKLTKVQAAFFEALRLFPAVYALLRETQQDCVINIPDLTRKGFKTVPIQKDTQVILDMIGLHRNPHTFEDPDEFKPERWYDMPNEFETLFAFGYGPRTCIGRKFALAEAVCFLTVLLRDWQIEPLRKPGQSVDQWYNELSQCHLHTTLTLSNIAVQLVRRA